MTRVLRSLFCFFFQSSDRSYSRRICVLLGALLQDRQCLSADYFCLHYSRLGTETRESESIEFGNFIADNHARRFAGLRKISTKTRFASSEIFRTSILPVIYLTHRLALRMACATFAALTGPAYSPDSRQSVRRY